MLERLAAWWFKPSTMLWFSAFAVLNLLYLVLTDGDGWKQVLWGFNAIIYACYAAWKVSYVGSAGAKSTDTD